MYEIRHQTKPNKENYTGFYVENSETGHRIYIAQSAYRSKRRAQQIMRQLNKGTKPYFRGHSQN